MSQEETKIENDTEAKPENDSDSQYEDIDDEDESKNVEPKSDESKLEEKSKQIKKDPSNIPRKGYFFEHDNREDEADAKENLKKGSNRRNFDKRYKNRGNIDDKWTHDRFDERQQQPKSKSELVKRYGYDIREEKDINSIKPTKKEEKTQTQKRVEDKEEESDEELYKKREDIIKNSDDDDFGQRLANLRRRKNYVKPQNNEYNDKQNFEDYKINRKNTNNFNNKRDIKFNNQNKSSHNDQTFRDKNYKNLENNFKNMSLKTQTNNSNNQNNNNNNEVPKRYSTIRNQNGPNYQQNQSVQQQQTLTLPQNQQVQQQYQMMYQNNNWQPSFPQNYTSTQNSNSIQMTTPPGLPISQNQNNRQYYYIPQNDYVAAQEYAAAMAASLMSNQIYYSNGTNGTQNVNISSPSLSPLTHGYSNMTHMHNQLRQSKAIPIVNPNRINK